MQPAARAGTHLRRERLPDVVASAAALGVATSDADSIAKAGGADGGANGGFRRASQLVHGDTDLREVALLPSAHAGGVSERLLRRRCHNQPTGPDDA